MTIPPKPAELENLEQSTGLEFAYIPAGTYAVGIAKKLGNTVAISASGSIWGKYFLETLVTLPEFWISTDLFRLSHWHHLQNSPLAARSNNILSPQETIYHKYAWSRKIISGHDYGFKGFLKDRIEDDPALTLHFSTSIKLSQAFGVEIPSWQEWEVATRGAEGYLFPWGNTFDLSALKLSQLRYQVTWEDPESTMGFRETETLRGFYYRIDDFGDYARAVSPFGLKGLMYWGWEWNSVDLDDPAVQTRTGTLESGKILRSLLDCGHSCSTVDASEREPENTALRRSNHRAFSGVHLAGFAIAHQCSELAAFRWVYRARMGSRPHGACESIDS